MSYNDELYHWGIKGMKWGIRRFQKKDGTLTALGKKRKRDDNDGDEPSKPKTVKDMSDSELKNAISRLEMEKRYNELKPEQVSRGKKFMSRMMENVLSPAAEDVAKQLAKSYMTDAVNKMFKLSGDLKVYTNNKKK